MIGGRLPVAGLLLMVTVVVSTTTVLVDAGWREELRRPRVALLGAGGQLSVLVTAGEARLLVATGDDPVAFGNALTRVRRATAPRLDVLLVAGEDRRLLAPAAIVGERRVGFLASLGPLGSSAEAATVGTTAVPVLSGSRRFVLPEGVRVTVEVGGGDGVEDAAGGEAEGVGVSWRMVVERGSSSVVVVSDGEAAARFPAIEAASVLVVAGEDPLASWEEVPAAVFVAAAEAVEGQEVRQAAVGAVDAPGWSVRVHPGEVASLAFGSGGVELAAGMAQRIGTPGAGVVVNDR